jgi:RNA recognition motif. (a.k.a. RRM, RBD, or RNP domain)
MGQLPKELSAYLARIQTCGVSVFVGGLGNHCNQKQLTQFMSQFGYVKEVYISKVKETNEPNGLAFVNFDILSRPDELFGLHNLKGNYIEVKRSLQGYLELQQVPIHASEKEIVSMFRDAGYRVVQILLGGKVGGIALNSAAVKLLKHHDHEQAIQIKSWKLLDQEIKIVLHAPKRVSDRTGSKTKKPTSLYHQEKRPFFESFGATATSNSLTSTNMIKVPYDPQLIRDSFKQEGMQPSSVMAIKRCDNNKNKPPVDPQRDFTKGCKDINRGPCPTDKSIGGDIFYETKDAQETLFRKIGIESAEQRMNRTSSPNNCYRELYPAVHHREQTAKQHTSLSDVDSDSSQTQEILIAFYAFPGHL